MSVNISFISSVVVCSLFGRPHSTSYRWGPIANLLGDRILGLTECKSPDPPGPFVCLRPTVLCNMCSLFKYQCHRMSTHAKSTHAKSIVLFHHAQPGWSLPFLLESSILRLFTLLAIHSFQILAISYPRHLITLHSFLSSE